MQALVLCCIPPPHVRLQGLYSDHSPHPPSTYQELIENREVFASVPLGPSYEVSDLNCQARSPSQFTEDWQMFSRLLRLERQQNELVALVMF